MEWTLFVPILPVLFVYSAMEFNVRQTQGVEIRKNFEPKDSRAAVVLREPVDLQQNTSVKFSPSLPLKSKATLGLMARVGK